MKKILITIKATALAFSFNYQSNDDTKLLMNTNVISNNELIFSDEYIINNAKILGLFLNDLIISKNIENIEINDFKILNIVSNAFMTLKPMNTLIIDEESNFTYEAYEILIKLNKFKKVNCFSIPAYLIELFDHNHIEIESRAEILFTSNFMEENNLISYSKIYYKMALRISPPLSYSDLNDFNTFCKINRYLKTIHFNACSIDAIDKISQILIKNRIKNVKIVIHDNITIKELVDKLKELKKNLIKYKIYLELKYTEEYVSKNYLKQVIVSTLATCALIIITILGGAVVYVVANNKQSEKNVEAIANQIEEKIAQDNLNNTKQISEDNKQDNTQTTTETKKILPKMASLLDLNSDTVGWLTVPGTNIDYPVLQTNDNSFYLSHNFNKEKDYNGWVFMHYLNVPQNLDKNTILFAHNRYYSGVMFGTLSNVTKKDWYENASNISIYYNTLYDEYEWEVFSIYKIDITDDYLKTIFKTDSDWLQFIEMIRDRSMFKSDAVVGVNDKIITLSTCLDNDQRLVVHAVLKKVTN